MGKQTVLYLFIIVFVVIFSCSLPNDNVIDRYENIMISSGSAALVIEMDTPVMLESEPGARGITDSRAARAQISDFEYDISQISLIRPTTVNNHTVQANDIIISGSTAYVAYNTAGNVFDGAIQIISIIGKKITLEKEIQFTDMDIISLSLHGNELAFGGMADPDVFEGNRSFIGKINLMNPKAQDIRMSFTFLSSYAATGVAYLNDQYYVSVGAASGGIKFLNKDMTPVVGTLTDLDIPADDIRDLEAFGSGVIALAGTTDTVEENGKVLIIKNNVLVKEIEIADFNSPEAKATIEVNGNYAYLGVSAKGFQVYDLVNENELFTFDNPDINPMHVTNSISFDDNLIFSANGEYGFRVLDYTPAATSAEIVGYYGFSGLEDSEGRNFSANHIAYKSRYLFVASGVGGVSIYFFSDK